MTGGLGMLLVLCISSTTCTDKCEMSATEISCMSTGKLSFLNQFYVGHAPHFRVIADAVRQFIPNAGSQRCRRQLLTFADALKNSSLWAVQMLDASAKTVEPGGFHLGHFDECTDVNLKRDGDNVRGKYCLADVSEYGTFELTRVGICVPNECGHKEVETFMGRYVSEVRKSFVSVRVTEDSCVTKGSARGRTGSTVLKYGVLGLVFWSVCVTMLDLINTNWEESSGRDESCCETPRRIRDIQRNVADMFSCYRNIQKLTSTVRETCPSGVHLMRVVAIFVLIMYQRQQLLTEGPVKNRPYLEKVSLSPWPIFDTLIFIAGFLTVKRLQDESLTNTKWKCFVMCMAKWLRMAPLYAGVVAFYAVAFNGIGDGPLWAEWIGRESRRCGDFWWANLSLLNNYISANGQCIAQSWYLAVTSHGFVVTLIFMHLKNGKAFVGLGSLVVSLTMSLVLFLWNDSVFSGYDGSPTLDNLYVRTQYRLPSFVVGAVSALLYHHIQNYKEKTIWVHFLAPFGLTILGFVAILCRRLDKESKVMLALVSSLTWSAFIGFVIIIFPLYNIRIRNGTLLKSVFIPLSRLSYPALLSHNIVQLYLIGSMRTSEYVTYPRLVWMGAADILASYVSALLLHVIIDGPVVSAVKIMFWSKEKETDESTEGNAEKK